MDFPDEMKQEKRWCAWFYQEVDPNNVHTRKKIPHNLNTKMCRERASDTDQTTWGSYPQANNAYTFTQNYPDWARENQYGGLGFMISDGWAFLDLDNIPTVIADYNLGQHNLISQLLETLDHTYCEVSQSQSGLHFIFKLDSTVDSFHKKEHNKELYDNGRMVALTGNVLDTDQPLKITTINQEQWKKLNQLVFGKYEKPMDKQGGYKDMELSQVGRQEPLSEAALKVIDGIMKSQYQRRVKEVINGRTVEKRVPECILFNWWLTADLPAISTNASGQRVSDWEDDLIDYDPSSQDMACCNMLAYWTNDDSQLMDEILTHTHLYRPKWNRVDYRQRTIGNAIEQHHRTLKAYKRRTNSQFTIKGLTDQIG